ncbi:hypothetical protein ABW21_db0206877 [Orbilia brochopaga]|nr:hypothetical protein ABW21_db0206877 [Drechslerella brochopaga]
MIVAKAAALVFLATAVSAAPATTPQPVVKPWNFLALRSASPIHFGSLEASGLGIWIGKPTASYCPVDPKYCPPVSNTTSILVTENAYGAASMDVIVPGGQQVYIAPSGALSYTQAHSAAIPAGSFRTGFIVSLPGSNGISIFSHCEGGFVACPVVANKGPWKVFVAFKGVLPKNTDVPSGKAADCLGFSAATAGPAQYHPGAWQYT